MQKKKTKKIAGKDDRECTRIYANKNRNRRFTQLNSREDHSKGGPGNHLSLFTLFLFA